VSLDLPRLQNIRLVHCRKYGHLCFLSHFLMLLLTVSLSTSFSNLFLKTTFLVRFADLNLMTLMLSSILVSNCPVLHRINITSNSLQVCHNYHAFIFCSHICLYCNGLKGRIVALQKLTIPKQDSLTTLALQCQSLQEVDLSECESLNNSVCNVFNDGGGCPVLKSLILDNCEVYFNHLVFIFPNLLVHVHH